jgi:hypothetical protein
MNNDKASAALIGALAIAAAVGAVLAGTEPTGSAPADAALPALFAAGLTIAASVARRWTWLVLAAAAAALARSRVELVVAAISVLAAFTSVLRREREPVVGAFVAATAVQVFLRGPSYGFQGLPSVVVAVVVGAVCVSAWRVSPRRTRRVTAWAAVGVCVFATLASVGLGVSALSGRSRMIDAVADAEAGLSAAKHGNQDEAVARLTAARTGFEDAEAGFTSPWALPSRSLPIVGQHASAMTTMAQAGAAVTSSAVTAADSAPYRDIKPAGGRVDLALLAEMEQPVAEAAASLDEVETELRDAGSPWLLAAVADPLDDLAAEVRDAQPDAALAADALRVVPGMIGADGPRHYLVVFGTPSESRGLGGFIGAYGELTANGGAVDFTGSGRTSDLVDPRGLQNRTLSGPEEFLQRYGRFRPERYFQNLTVSPDFPTDASVIAEMYPQTGGPPLDGVLYVDPYGLAAFLKLTGPVEVEGLPAPLTAENAAQFLLLDQYLLYPNTEERSDLLFEALDSTFSALTERDLPGPGEAADALAPAVRSGRLFFTAFEPGPQQLLTSLGATGAFPENPDGDLLSVRVSNAGPNKIDAYLERDIDYDVTYNPSTGVVEAKATITLRNTAPASGLPHYVIGNSSTRAQVPGPPEGTNLTWLSVYSPLDLTSAEVDGTAVPVQIERELGVRVYSSDLQIPPGSEVTLVLELNGEIAVGDDYDLVMVQQPLVNNDSVLVNVRSSAPDWQVVGEGAESFNLSKTRHVRTRFEPSG